MWVRHITQPTKPTNKRHSSIVRRWVESIIIIIIKNNSYESKDDVWGNCCETESWSVPTRLANISGGVWDVLPNPNLKHIFLPGCLIRTVFLYFSPDRNFSQSLNLCFLPAQFLQLECTLFTRSFSLGLWREVPTLCVVSCFKVLSKKGNKKRMLVRRVSWSRSTVHRCGRRGGLLEVYLSAQGPKGAGRGGLW